mmetsp:Transcript_12445/g.26817  ORF Transcript_12445/g.26817 Transcript_12445/m.26817 type:complete len:207 (+) Transcript_12445:757-1377(+)
MAPLSWEVTIMERIPATCWRLPFLVAQLVDLESSTLALDFSRGLSEESQFTNELVSASDTSTSFSDACSLPSSGSDLAAPSSSVSSLELSSSSPLSSRGLVLSALSSSSMSRCSSISPRALRRYAMLMPVRKTHRKPTPSPTRMPKESLLLLTSGSNRSAAANAAAASISACLSRKYCSVVGLALGAYVTSSITRATTPSAPLKNV